ncbi:hypothetical protein EVAR_14077_1 [Eumeta japonica]|uniref:Uncharacterized protein n=1 Tax=Eumeta variegata TaxID=151549 RepID=A0A4C1UN64_EUMVA|nr:hypothetical protein EVAR_14077_1 [Eumeta japonica]
MCRNRERDLDGNRPRDRNRIKIGCGIEDGKVKKNEFGQTPVSRRRPHCARRVLEPSAELDAGYAAFFTQAIRIENEIVLFLIQNLVEEITVSNLDSMRRRRIKETHINVLCTALCSSTTGLSAGSGRDGTAHNSHVILNSNATHFDTQANKQASHQRVDGYRRPWTLPTPEKPRCLAEFVGGNETFNGEGIELIEEKELKGTTSHNLLFSDCGIRTSLTTEVNVQDRSRGIKPPGTARAGAVSAVVRRAAFIWAFRMYPLNITSPQVSTNDSERPRAPFAYFAFDSRSVGTYLQNCYKDAQAPGADVIHPLKSGKNNEAFDRKIAEGRSRRNVGADVAGPDNERADTSGASRRAKSLHESYSNAAVAGATRRINPVEF